MAHLQAYSAASSAGHAESPSLCCPVYVESPMTSSWALVTSLLAVWRGSITVPCLGHVFNALGMLRFCVLPKADLMIKPSTQSSQVHLNFD